MPEPVTPLDTFALQRIQIRVEAIRANVQERDGREHAAGELDVAEPPDESLDRLGQREY